MGDVLLAAVAVGLLVAAVYLVARGMHSVLWRLLVGVRARYLEARCADRRAEALLRDVLTPTEYARMLVRGYLDVRSPRYPGRVYRIPRDGGIVVLCESGRVIGGLCVQAVEPIPAADAVALHKLMIEGAEEEYLRRANHLSFGSLSRYGLAVLYVR